MEYRPKITVLMSIFNGETFLKEAIESILQQTFKDFEFLIINDCSSDSSLAIINTYSDSRIRIVNNETNLGLTKSLNIGLNLALGNYIARMDDDDVSFKDRLEKQFNFLEQNIDVGVLGTQAISNGRFFKYATKLPLDDYSIKWNLFFTNPIIHPGVMFRKDIVLSNGGYNEDKKVGQDYDLWTRLTSKARFANLPESYIFLRRHENNISVKNFKKQHIMAIETIKTFLKSITNKDFSNEEMEAFFFQNFRNYYDRAKTIQLISKLYDIFIQSNELTELEKKAIFRDTKRRINQIQNPKWTKILSFFSI
jgi:glycosyltransferase involved in cell wall biosynthesis